MNIESLEERRAVDAGQMWLDEQLPGWWMRGHVYLTRFDVASACTCILAQATGLDYSSAVTAWKLGGNEQIRLGFLAPPGSCRETYYGNLTRYWREAILRRRKAYTLSRQTPQKRRMKAVTTTVETEVALAA